jgi:hypothetical protein
MFHLEQTVGAEATQRPIVLLQLSFQLVAVGY